MEALQVASLFASLDLKDNFKKPMSDARGEIDQTEKAANSLTRTLSGIGGFLRALPIAGLFAGMLGEAMEAEHGLKLLQSTLKSTADVTVKVRDENGKWINQARPTEQAILAQADALSKLTRFSDDSIISVSTMLATFTKIGKEAMPLATEAVLDMATIMGGDTQGAAVQLGKALNDPVNGITALTRVGVTFTAQQQQMIRRLVASGDLLGAQKIILGELKTEFGGAARAAGDTFAGKLDILKNSVGNILEQFGNLLLPILNSVADGFLSVLDSVGELDPVFGALIIGAGVLVLALSPLGALIGAIAAPVAVLTGAVVGLAAVFNSDFLGIKTAVETVWNSVAPIFAEIQGAIKALFYNPANDIDAFMGRQVEHRLGRGTLKPVNPQQQGRDAANPTITNVTRGGESLQKNTLVDQLILNAKDALPRLLAALGDLGSTIGGWFKDGVKWLVDNGPTELGNAIRGLFDTFGDIGVWLRVNGPDIGKSIGSWIRDALNSVVETGADLLSKLFQGIFGGGDNLGKSTSEALRDMANPSGLDVIGQNIIQLFTGVIDTIFGLFAGLFGIDEEGSIGKAISDFFKEGGGFATIKKNVSTAFTKLRDGIGDILKGIGNFFMNPVKEALRLVAKALISVNMDVLGVNTSKVGYNILDAIQGLGVGVQGPVLPPFDGGGYTGNGPANQAAGVVHKGEWVVPQNGALVVRGNSGGTGLNIGTVIIQGNDDPAAFFDGIQREAQRKGFQPFQRRTSLA